MAEPCAVPGCATPRVVGRLCLLCFVTHVVLLGWPLAMCALDSAAAPPVRPRTFRPAGLDRWEEDGGRHG